VCRELIEVVYKDSKGLNLSYHTFVTVPIDPSINKITRAVSLQLQPAPPQRNNNNININNNFIIKTIRQKRVQICQRRCNYRNCINKGTNNINWRRIQPPVFIDGNKIYNDEARERKAIKAKISSDMFTLLWIVM
jgi:hypothetical protein